MTVTLWIWLFKLNCLSQFLSFLKKEIIQITSAVHQCSPFKKECHSSFSLIWYHPPINITELHENQFVAALEYKLIEINHITVFFFIVRNTVIQLFALQHCQISLDLLLHYYTALSPALTIKADMMWCIIQLKQMIFILFWNAWKPVWRVGWLRFWIVH